MGRTCSWPTQTKLTHNQVETIMIKLCVAFIDGTFVEQEYLNDEIESVELMIEGTPKDLLCRVEVEDSKQTLIYQYKRKSDYAY
jgi:hypothetical protein